tara:strand:- start:308 stop:499 length:192 start_codon:yes stop_codon:yes gene_type:complete
MVLGQVELKMVEMVDQEVVHQAVLHQQEVQEILLQFRPHKVMMEVMVEVALEDQEVVVLVQQV